MASTLEKPDSFNIEKRLSGTGPMMLCSVLPGVQVRLAYWSPLKKSVSRLPPRFSAARPTMTEEHHVSFTNNRIAQQPLLMTIMQSSSITRRKPGEAELLIAHFCMMAVCECYALALPRCRIGIGVLARSTVAQRVQNRMLRPTCEGIVRRGGTKSLSPCGGPFRGNNSRPCCARLRLSRTLIPYPLDFLPYLSGFTSGSGADSDGDYGRDGDELSLCHWKRCIRCISALRRLYQ